MDSSEADSEEDRRAYGQYASLDAYGSDVDEQAAAYLHSVQLAASLIGLLRLHATCRRWLARLHIIRLERPFQEILLAATLSYMAVH